MHTLSDLIEAYLIANTRIAKQQTREHYRRSVRQFEQHLGRTATLDDLNDDALASWMRATVASGLREVTANQRAKQLRAAWAWAAKRRIVDRWPTVPRLREPEPMPVAWTMPEVVQLFQAAREAEGYVGPHRARDWWLALHLVIWDTGERIGAVLRLERSMVDFEQRVARVPARIRKGGRLGMVYRLRAETCAALEPLYLPPTDTGLIFEHSWRDPKTLYGAYKRLVQRAGLRWDRRLSGFGKLRRTVLTQVELRGGNATAFARHSSRRVTEASYLDRAQLLAAEGDGVWPAPATPASPQEQPRPRWWRLLGRS